MMTLRAIHVYVELISIVVRDHEAKDKVEYG